MPGEPLGYPPPPASPVGGPAIGELAGPLVGLIAGGSPPGGSLP